MGVARADHQPDGYSLFTAVRLNDIEHALRAVALIRAAERNKERLQLGAELIALRLHKLIPEAEVIRSAEPAVTGLVLRVESVDDEIGVAGSLALILEVDAADARGPEMLHIVGVRIQNVIHHEVGTQAENGLPQFLLALAHAAVILPGYAFHCHLGLARAHEGNFVIRNLVGQHESAVDMPHADGGPSRNHEDHVPALKQVFADPPVLVGLDLDGPVIEKIGHHVLHFGGASLGKPAHKRLRAEDNDGAALDHDLAFALIVIEKLGKILALHAPDALMHAFHRD